ncbi:TPT-domain-containing protein [Dacryopinax primogenitus]|uniref:TPT-domain-containing protein n=1 Tax=Dacryopinax primogenitus (strain DJM 731) TaxID=1858805 RepID=M5GDA7_DACPD|nr:TPT-domain-containing protein [Dacryopinax primogenitus]EJU04397.1 TPT-domain-containing protein [Dacryopinax primogenitus]
MEDYHPNGSASSRRPDSLEALEAELAFTDDRRERDDRGVPPRLATVEQKKWLWVRNAVINAFFILGWYLFATILSVYNKWMFSPEHFGFPFPLFVTTIHMIVQWCMAALVRFLFPSLMKSPGRPSRREYGSKIIPCAVTTGLDIGLSNLSLKTITLSFYTMCKSSSLGFVLLFAFLFRLERPSLFLVGVILIITVGVLLMVFTETHFVLIGAILVLSASACGGLRWSLTQLLLRKHDMGLDTPASTLYWLAPIMALTLLISSAVVEGLWNVFTSEFFQGTRVFKTLFFVVLPGLIAFLMVLSEFYIIKRAGVLPMSIAGIFKEVSTISVSTWLFGDHLTPVNITGVGITIIGIALFTWHKYKKSLESDVKLDTHGLPIEEDTSPEPEGQVLLPENDREEGHELMPTTDTLDEGPDVPREEYGYRVRSTSRVSASGAEMFMSEAEHEPRRSMDGWPRPNGLDRPND